MDVGWMLDGQASGSTPAWLPDTCLPRCFPGTTRPLLAEAPPRLAVRTSTPPVARPCHLMALLTQPPPRTEGWLAFMGPPLPFQAFALGPGFLQRLRCQLRQVSSSTAHWPGALVRTHGPAHFTKLRTLSTQERLEPHGGERSRAERSVQHEQVHISLLHSSASTFPMLRPLPFLQHPSSLSLSLPFLMCSLMYWGKKIK